MKASPPPPVHKTTASDLLTTYGPFVLSVLSILVVALGWFLHDLDTNTAIVTIGAILGANGLVGATRWQAAPGLIADLQQIIGQLASHIQALHAQQLAQSNVPVAQSIPAAAAAAPGADANPQVSAGG